MSRKPRCRCWVRLWNFLQKERVVCGRTRGHRGKHLGHIQHAPNLGAQVYWRFDQRVRSSRGDRRGNA